jgi:hypothetical protein
MLLAVAIRTYGKSDRTTHCAVDVSSVVSAGVGDRVAFEVGCRKKIRAS